MTILQYCKGFVGTSVVNIPDSDDDLILYLTGNAAILITAGGYACEPSPVSVRDDVLTGPSVLLHTVDIVFVRNG